MLLGLDLGEKRVGTAIADETLGVATPLETLEIRGRKHLVQLLTRIIEEHRVSKIIVGLPKTLKGEMGPAAENVMMEVEWLKSRINCPWVFWDERLTTKEVDRVMMDAGLRNEERKKFRDQLSAQRILQSYLDNQRLTKG